MDIKQAALPTAAAQTADESAPMVRRRILAAGVSGAALSLLPWLSDRAGAQARTAPPTSGGATTATTPATTTPPTTVAPAPTTTAPPKRPTTADIELLAVAQSIELAIRDLYDAALGAKSFEGATAEAVTAIREAHEAYAQSISGLIGSDAKGLRSEKLYNAQRSNFTGSTTSVAQAAAKLENVASATHLEILGSLIGIDAAALIASVLVVEARHATVLNTIAGASTLSNQLANDGVALSPADYPVK
ncbi:MAG: ferritin-like domain-containing protein [Actinomycetota bacterium]